MKASVYAAALAGLGLAIAIVAYSGLSAVAGALLAAGWGLVIVTLFHFLPLALSASAWRTVLPANWRATTAFFLWARLIRESTNDLLPVAQIGGALVGARTLTLHGAPSPVAGASVVVDVTLETLTHFVFTLIGLGLLVLNVDDAPLMGIVLAGLVAALALVGFVLAQRWGLLKLLDGLLTRAAKRWNWHALGAFADLHDTALQLYGRPKQVCLGFLLHLACWILGAGEVWLALHFMGHDVSIGYAVILESLGQAVRGAAFLVPGALGVQEGGFVLFGALLGLSPETSLALSLAKRVRELALGVPTLVILQVLEGRRFWRYRKRLSPNR